MKRIICSAAVIALLGATGASAAPSMPSHISKDGHSLLQLTKGQKSPNASPTAGTGGNSGGVAMPPKGKPDAPPKGGVATPPKSPKASK
jgi:hypothetical protein